MDSINLLSQSPSIAPDDREVAAVNPQFADLCREAASPVVAQMGWTLGQSRLMSDPDGRLIWRADIDVPVTDIGVSRVICWQHAQADGGLVVEIAIGQEVEPLAGAIRLDGAEQ